MTSEKNGNQFPVDDLGRFILNLLNECPRSSDEIIQDVDKEYRGSYSYDADDIYFSLDELELFDLVRLTKKIVRASDKRGNTFYKTEGRSYSITDEGRRLLNKQTLFEEDSAVSQVKRPLSRDDLIKLMEENGGKAWELDLSEAVFEEGVDLSGLDLEGIILKKASLSSVPNPTVWAGSDIVDRGLAFPSYFQECDFSLADLEGAGLQSAHLEGVDFTMANLKATDFRGAYLSRTRLTGAYFDESTRFENVRWGDRVLGDEGHCEWQEVADIYRRLRNWHAFAGHYDEAGEFFYREMTARRKASWWGRERGRPLKQILRTRHLWSCIAPQRPFHWVWAMLVNVLCGYGERPFRVLISAVSVVLGLAIIYLGIGTLTPNSFMHCLYYSAVSFTALGYGSWAPQPTGWVRGIGAFEAFVGVFMMALFLVTFIRKMTR